MSSSAGGPAEQTPAADAYLYDAVVILGGGLTANGEPNDFVKARLDEGARHCTRFFVCLSRGTTHKPPPHDAKGFPVDESTASAQYLVSKHGIAAERIIKDTWSLDTIGNAIFCMAMVCAPLGLHRLLVVTSKFHMPRTRLIFDWITPLWHPSATVAYSAAPNHGLSDEALELRRDKEKGGCEHVARQARAHPTRMATAQFLLLEHGAYAVAPAPQAAPALPVDKRVLDSY